MSRRTENQERLRDAMASLILHEPFRVFMETLREMREGAIAYAISHTAVKDQRESLAALGEIRTYDDILNVYQAAHQQPEHQMADEEAPRS